MKNIILATFLLVLFSCGQSGGLAPSGSSMSNSPNCGGVSVGGHCWYYGLSNQSCGTVCADHGGYNNATETYVGKSGTSAACLEVSNALGAVGSTIWENSNCSQGFGCAYDAGSSTRVRCTNLAADETSAANGVPRVCACNE